MAQQNDGDGNIDPAATTGKFQRFVSENPAPEQTPQHRPVLPIVLGIVAAVALVAVIVIAVIAMM